MNILAITTSTDHGSVAVLSAGVRGQKALGQVKWSRKAGQTQNSDALILKIQALLKKFKLKPTHLNAIAVDKGPGSFTGCRVAVNVAKTFGYTLNIPIIPIFSLDAMAYAVALTLEKKSSKKKNAAAKHSDTSSFIVVIDAHKSLVYCRQYLPQAAGKPPTTQSTVAARSLGELEKLISDKTLVCGVVPKIFAESFSSKGANVEELYPEAKIIGLLAAQGFSENDKTLLSSWREVEPSYVRAPEAVEKLQQK